MPLGRRMSAGLLGLALMMTAPAQAAMLKTYPVRLTLTPKEPVATMTIQNSGTEPTVLQLKVLAWRQENGEDVFEPTREVLANPGIFELAPGTEQVARFGLQAGAAAKPGNYRVFIQEVPRRQAQKPGEVITLLQISVPIFAPPSNAAARLTWQVQPTADGKLSVEVRNEGDDHIQVTGLSLARAGGERVSDQKMSTYVLPGAWRRVTMDVHSPVKPGERLSLKAETDQAPIAEAVVVGGVGAHGQDPR
jgi:fimbrial chaperone protein